jgi:DNA-binding transcriptional ArsR family regulator
MGAMTADVVELARVAGLLADPTRAAICMALIDGRAWTATELARHAGVAPSTASEQLSKLVSGGLLTEHRQGRHRYLALAGPHVAELLEDLSARLHPSTQAPPTTLKAANASAALRRGRTCYDHLAGVLGVAVTDAMTTAGLIRQDAGFALTDAGLTWFAGELDITDLDAPTPGRRPLVRACLDWTQRRPHLAGVAGARLCARFFERNWITRVGTGRAVRATPSGRRALAALLAVDPATLDA